VTKFIVTMLTLQSLIKNTLVASFCQDFQNFITYFFLIKIVILIIQI